MEIKKTKNKSSTSTNPACIMNGKQVRAIYKMLASSPESYSSKMHEIARSEDCILFLDKEEGKIHLVAEDNDTEYYYEEVVSESDLINKLKEQYLLILF